MNRKMLLYTLNKQQLSSVTARYLGLYDGKQYSIPDLEYIVQHTAVRLTAILRTQKNLTESFCRDYLLSGEYTILDGDDILISDIIQYQPHLMSCFEEE